MTGEENRSNKIQELQMIEQNLQNILYQKQSFQSEVNEISNALDELKSTKEDPYKIISGIMLKADKNELIKELEEKLRTSKLKVDSVEKQEKILSKKSAELRDEIVNSSNQGKK